MEIFVRRGGVHTRRSKRASNAGASHRKLEQCLRLPNEMTLTYLQDQSEAL